MAKIPAIILAYANNPDSRLEYLVEEIIAVEKHLRVLRDQFQVIPIYNATITKIRNEVSEYGDRVVAFMYSGHSGIAQIETVNDPMSAIGLVNALSECLMLKLVLINGCSSIGHETQLSSKQIPIILLTEAPINDKAATIFSAFFWKAISEGKTVSEAFREGKDKAQDYRNVPIEEIMGTEDHVRSLDTGNGRSDNPWMLKTSTPADIEWTLDAAVEDFKYINEFETNKYLKETLYTVFADIDPRIGGRKDFTSAKNMIYSKFPLFVTKHIHDLCAVPLPGQETTSYFTEPDLKRLEKIMDFFQALKELVKSLTLAEIREQLIRKSAAGLPQNLIGLFTQKQWHTNTKMSAILSGLDFLKGKVILVKELIDLDQDVLRDTEAFFAEMKIRIGNIESQDTPTHEKLNLKDLRRLCEVAEVKISELLKQLIFLREYKFVTIKNITVYKNRVKPEPSYGFALSTYEWNEGEDQPWDSNEKILEKEAPDNACILIVPNSDDLVKDLVQDTQYLNLSPFLIDNNSLLFDKAQIPDISFCEEVLSQEFIYKPLNRPSDKKFTRITSVDKNNVRFYKNLKEQFEHFDLLLANQATHGPNS